MRLIHISDLHIRSDMKHNKVVAEKLRYIRGVMTTRDTLVITGDIVDDGKEKQYDNALALLLPFKGKLVLAPGNHDYAKLGNFYDPDCVKRFKKFRDELKANKSLVLKNSSGKETHEIVVIDSNLKTGTIVDFAQGKLGWLKRMMLRQKLSSIKTKELQSVVVLHHNPFYTDWFCRLQDAKEFLDVVYGNADYVLMGHEHKERRIVYPQSLPESQAKTRLFAAASLQNEKTSPLIIQLEV